MERKNVLMNGISKELYGLEIGGSINPCAPKAEGYNCDTLDHMDKKGLMEKYNTHSGIDINQIGEVDYVWNGESYSNLIGKQGCYDYVIASHVIEHTTDLITFLQECSKILKFEGVLKLAIPDKRYIFDCFRNRTSLSKVIDDYVNHKVIHSEGSVAEYFLNTVCIGSNKKIGWSPKDSFLYTEFEFIHNKDMVLENIRKVNEMKEYIDIHEYVFTLSSFLLIIYDLRQLGYIDFTIEGHTATNYGEFMVELKKKQDSTRGEKIDFAYRLKLMKGMLREVSDMNFISTKLEVNIDNLSSDKDVLYAIDEIETVQEKLVVSGWCYISKVCSDDCSIYVGIFNKDIGMMDIYSTKSIERRDVSRVFCDDLYINSGFTANIIRDTLQNYDLYIFIKYKDQVYRIKKN